MKRFYLLSLIVLLLLFRYTPTFMAVGIAFDAAVDGTDNGGSTTSLSWSHTSTGSNRAGFIGCLGDFPSNTDVTDVHTPTWTGGTVTLVDEVAGSANTDMRNQYLWYVVGQSSGSQTVQVVRDSPSEYLICGSVSYNGVSQTGNPVEHTTNVDAGTAVTSLTTSLTLSVANSWTVLYMGQYAANTAPVAGTGSTRRTYNNAFGAWGFFDSGSAQSTGSYSMSTTSTVSTAGVLHLMASIKPAISATTCNGALMLFGVGGC